MGLSDQKRIRYDILDLKVWISQAEAVPFFARPKCSDYTGSDVVGGAENDSAMADKRAKRGGTNYFAAGGPNKVNCSSRTGTPGISVHCFPKTNLGICLIWWGSNKLGQYLHGAPGRILQVLKTDQHKHFTRTLLDGVVIPFVIAEPPQLLTSVELILL